MVSLDSTCKVEVFSSNINVDRYHLLKFNNGVDNQDIIYEEDGCAFNGFYNPLILNVSADVVCDSRLLALTLLNVNSSLRVFYLITNVEYVTNNKCKVYIEYDAWMNLRNKIRYGEQNDLFKCSEVITDYPYSDVHADYYKYNKIENLAESTYWNFIFLYHNSSENVDYVYVTQILKNSPYISDYNIGVGYASEIIYDLGLDINQVVSMYISPFDVNVSSMDIVRAQDDNYTYRRFIDWFLKDQGDNPIVTVCNLTYSPISKRVITDAEGSVVWTNNRELVGPLNVYLRLELDYSSCFWSGYVDDNLPDRRFTISCLTIPYFADYYQQYQNLEKEYNHSVRMAQLDLQIQEGIGDTIAAGTWHGTSSGMSMSPSGGKVAVPQTATLGLAGGLIGGAIQTTISGIATNEYYKKLSKIENKKALMQYDVVGCNTGNSCKFIRGLTIPAVYEMYVDICNYTVNTELHSLIFVGLDYNCHIHGTKLQNLIEVIKPRYISGDFDFLGISEEYAIQLNSRFKHGVNFVNWRD